jgi:hypothetical protein
MQHDPYIPDGMWQRVTRELDTIEHGDGVRILLAVESGSRAWRFPSVDSDYDVRFIYVRPSDAYLSIEAPREDIERPPTDVLDINGWDLRKALRLLLRSNAVLLEWLASPVRYRDSGAESKRVHALARATCMLPALSYHYYRMARHNFDQIVSSSDGVPLKTYCYALRPALALLWMRRHGEPPPMDLPRLLDHGAVDRAVHRALQELVDRKAEGTERDVTQRVPVLDAFLADALNEPVSQFQMPDRSAALSSANELFASIIRGQAAP